MKSKYLMKLYKRIEDFVMERYSGEGGFMMSPVDYPNPAATYYSISILENIGKGFKEKDRCTTWLTKFKIESIYSLYYLVKSLILLEQESIARKRLLENIYMILENAFLSPVQKVYEIEQEFKKLNYISELSKLSNSLSQVFEEKLVEAIIGHQNEDGGFGLKGHSTLTSTYHALNDLNILGRLNLVERKNVLKYVRACERPEGGFVTRPENILPYIEYTYYGVEALKILDEVVNFPVEHIKFALNCVNRDGGFRRTIVLGISNLENVYYATSLLKTLEAEKFILG